MELTAILGLLVKYGPDAVDFVMDKIAKGEDHVTPAEWVTLKGKLQITGEQLIPERPGG